MLPLLITIVATFFAGMGAVALMAPEYVSTTVGFRMLTPAGRNEVRAVYGGFGLAMSGLLFAAPSLPAMAAGIYLSVAAALAGMAAGRLLAAAVERPGGFYPAWFYCGVEAAMAGILLVASGMRS